MTVPFADRPLPAWHDDAKLGIFVHWGPYAVPCWAPLANDMGEMMEHGNWADAFRATPYTEWYLNSWAIEGSPVAAHHESVYGPSVTYADFVASFLERAGGASVADWVPLFAAAGARYVVPVTKHHDGFLMWHSDVPNPHRDGWMAQRDHIGELAAATADAGMRFGVYYSGGLDWTFVPPPITDLASLIAAVPNSPEYAEYATAHVHELIERFRPCALWNDIGWPSRLDPNDLFARYYAAVPDGIVNDRFDIVRVARGQLHADIATPEYSTKPRGNRKWEVCRGIGRGFGYNREETEATLLSPDELIWMLVDVVARGGNLLLNVGPGADGQIPFGQALRLTALGWWLRVDGAAIYGTRPRGTCVAGDGRAAACTVGADGTRFVIAQGAPSGTWSVPVDAPGDGAEVRMLGNARPLPWRWRDGTLSVELPDHLPPAPATAFSISS
ncbi:MAG: alpha-L-fucosidase [Ilumatobacteraceae bacterium]